jgi:pyrroloquinoline quinone (PQQ) biosynthesis protein C
LNNSLNGKETLLQAYKSLKIKTIIAMRRPSLTPAQIEQYHREGYLIIKAFLKPEEAAKLYEVAVEDDAVSKNAININDSSGKKSKLSLWYKPGNDIYGLLTRSKSLWRL